MSSVRNRILLVVDGSDQSFDTVTYASKIFAPAKTEVTLFHVMNKVPDAFWDWEEDPLIPQHLEYMKGWEAQKEQKMRELMENARRVFIDAGFPEAEVFSRIQERRSGIARDIIDEARSEYDAVLVGRKGLSSLDEQMLGSVAGKIVGKLTDVSVCLVGGKPRPGRFLVGIDGSQGAWRAVNFLAKMVGGCDPAVTLLHVLRAPNHGQTDVLSADQVDKLTEEARKALRPAFEKATEVLVEAGANPAKISTKTATGASSRAGALTEEARQGDFGTIVVGRRGLSKVEQFQMGRVTNKLTQVGRNLAIWIASA